MKKVKTRAAIAVLVALALVRLNANAAMAGSGQTEVDALAAKLANHEIGKVEILQMPAGLLTRITTTPDMLEQQFFYKLTIRDLRGGAYEAGLTTAVKSMSVQPRTDTVDLRWAAIFYSPEGVRVGALYFDGTGRAGTVGIAPVSFTGGFFDWLSGHFASCLQ